MEDFLFASEEVIGIVGAHGQDIGDGFISVLDIEDIGLEAFSAAITARDLDIRHELHIDEGETESFAGWASAVAGVEAKVSIAESLEFCFG